MESLLKHVRTSEPNSSIIDSFSSSNHHLLNGLTFKTRKIKSTSNWSENQINDSSYDQRDSYISSCKNVCLECLNSTKTTMTITNGQTWNTTQFGDQTGITWTHHVNLHQKESSLSNYNNFCHMPNITLGRERFFILNSQTQTIVICNTKTVVLSS